MKTCCLLISVAFTGCRNDENVNTRSVYPGEVHRMHPPGENLHLQEAIPIPESTSAERVTHTGELVAVRDVSSNVPIHSGELVQPNEQNFRDLKKAFYACALEGCPTVSPKVEQYELELYLNSVLGVDALVWAGVGRKVLNKDISSLEASLVSWASNLSGATRMDLISRPLAADIIEAKENSWLMRSAISVVPPADRNMVLYWFNGVEPDIYTNDDLNAMTQIVTEQSKTNGAICLNYLNMIKVDTKITSSRILECQKNSQGTIKGMIHALFKNFKTIEFKRIRRDIYMGTFSDGKTPGYLTGLSAEDITKRVESTFMEYLPVDAKLWEAMIGDRWPHVYATFVYKASLATRDQLAELSTFVVAKMEGNDVYEKVCEWAQKIPISALSIEDSVRKWINGSWLQERVQDITPIVTNIVEKDIGRNGAVCVLNEMSTIECEDSVEKDPTLIAKIVAILVEKYEKVFENARRGFENRVMHVPREKKLGINYGSYSSKMIDID